MSFLDLPTTCRDEIYALSGLVRYCPIDLTTEHLRAKNGDTINEACCRFKRRAFTYLKHQADSGMPRSRRERERFICFGPVLSLSLFRACKEISLEAYRVFYSSNKFQLRIVEAADLLCLSRLSTHTISSLRSLHVDFVPNESSNNGSGQPGEPLHQWSAVIQEVSKHITPSLLSFALTAQSADMETAGILLQSIQSLPHLKKCALSIGPHRNSQVRLSVQAIGAQMVGRAVAHTASFSFEQLPKELRLSILKKTDLVQNAHLSSAYGSIYMERYDDWVKTRNKCCSRCNDCLESCCCIWKPAAYSLTCICRPLPTALFTVSRQMSYEAQEVFFSKNIFILARPLSSIAFIEGLNSYQLAHIRRLELYFRENDAMSLWSLHAEKIQSEWRHVIEMLRTRLNLEKLELRVNLARFNDPMDMHEPDMDELENTIQEILRPLKNLDGIHKLFIYLGHFERLEADAERAVMGQFYDAVEEGKPPAYHSFI